MIEDLSDDSVGESGVVVKELAGSVEVTCVWLSRGAQPADGVETNGDGVKT